MEPVAVIGGTGPQGSGLALRLALAGHRVFLGSRSLERATAKAAELSGAGGVCIEPVSNEDAVRAAEIVLLAIPYDGHDDLVAELAPMLSGKVVITCVNPLAFDRSGPVGLLAGTSAAEATQKLVPDAAVVGAFHHLSAVALNDPSVSLADHTVMVCADDEDAADRVAALAASVTGRTGVCVGALRLARHLEPLTAVLISTNRRYRAHSGIAMAAVPEGLPVRR